MRLLLKAAHVRSTTKATKTVASTTKRQPKATAKNARKREAEAWLKEAWKVYRQGYYNRAAELTKRALKVMPRNQQALSISGASACYLKRTDDAKSAYRRLSTQRKDLLQQFCQRMGVSLE